MNAFNLPRLPLGRSSFAALRERNCIYVDKTDLICSLAQYSARIFPARPRRFGKSLLVSALESLFRHGLRDFRGLAIENLWNDKTYAVLHLDFSMTRDFQTLKEFLDVPDRVLVQAARNAGLDIDQSAQDPIARFASLLSRQSPEPLVLLIDEYDAPLTEHLDDSGLFGQVMDSLIKFCSSVSALGGCLRFFFMTGIIKFSSNKNFPGIPDLRDISLELL